MIVVKYKHPSDDPDAFELRTLFCKEDKTGRNPLIETPFNALLEKICQTAFDEGREYQRKQKE